MAVIYSMYRVGIEVEGHLVTLTHKDEVICQVQVLVEKHQWLTPERVGQQLRSYFTMALGRDEKFNVLGTLNQISKEMLSGPWALQLAPPTERASPLCH